MVAESRLTSDGLIKELGGCGRFQALLVFLVYLPHIPWAFSTLFMSFGAYNPGWKCLNVRTKKDGYYTHTLHDLARMQLEELNKNNNNINISNYNFNDDDDDDYYYNVLKVPEYMTDSCRGFHWCENVEFNPEASTIVTQWGLTCDREWILSLIIPLQMGGGLVGGLIIACVGDGFGRKGTLYTLLLCHVVLNVLCMFSVNVVMFISLRFLIGANDVLLGKLPIAYVLEFVPPRWRMIAGSIPVWTIGNILFAVSALLTKDWFLMSLIIASLSFACLVPVLWVPESPRWLAVNGKTQGLLRTGEKMAWMNRSNQVHDKWCELSDEVSQYNTIKKRFGIFNLFRRGYAFNASILGFAIMSADVLYFAAHFGASILPGNVYVNLILLAVMEIPANLIAALVPNVIGRRSTITITMLFQAFCLFGAVAVELILDRDHQDSAIVGLVLAGKLGTCIARSVLNVFTVEMYPTVVRSTASGYTGVMAMVGSMVAPLVVARRENEVYICYLLMSGLATICGCLVLMVPETKGKPLADTWEEIEVEEKQLQKEGGGERMKEEKEEDEEKVQEVIIVETDGIGASVVTEEGRRSGRRRSIEA